MYRSLKVLIAALILCMSVSQASAQDFPASEKEVNEILATNKWALDSLGKPGRMRSAVEAKMDGVTLSFNNDGTYTISVMGKDKPGKWLLDLAEKQVKMFEGRPDPDAIIKSMSKDQLVMVRGDGSDLKMVFKVSK